MHILFGWQRLQAQSDWENQEKLQEKLLLEKYKQQKCCNADQWQIRTSCHTVCFDWHEIKRELSLVCASVMHCVYAPSAKGSSL